MEPILALAELRNLDESDADWLMLLPHYQFCAIVLPQLESDSNPVLSGLALQRLDSIDITSEDGNEEYLRLFRELPVEAIATHDSKLVLQKLLRCPHHNGEDVLKAVLSRQISNNYTLGPDIGSLLYQLETPVAEALLEGAADLDSHALLCQLVFAFCEGLEVQNWKKSWDLLDEHTLEEAGGESLRPPLFRNWKVTNASLWSSVCWNKVELDVLHKIGVQGMAQPGFPSKQLLLEVVRRLQSLESSLLENDVEEPVIQSMEDFHGRIREFSIESLETRELVPESPPSRMYRLLQLLFRLVIFVLMVSLFFALLMGKLDLNSLGW
eukprot:NODE_1223_length_1229_cov_47.499153_g996_i0.p1 GENE.NODE_1223_length_1229_cov_47.499153_g996_i0~~NODE_1223_length_1229_cov_47.499153_g996_i0.p1  ORF type:complete len:361 (+),score=108.02 NODE_1223_length_1229_cov_47.499153_g996_i0:111-1085(+)